MSMIKYRPQPLALILLVVIASALTAIPVSGSTAVQASTPCLRAELVADVTVKDGTNFEPGEYFFKTWRLRNTGNCTWHRSFRLVFFGGENLSNRTLAYIKQEVKPGRTVDITIRMRAPDKVGEYTSYWMLRDREGHRFGIGASGNQAFWAKIKVSMPPQTAFNFANRPCLAIWHNASGGIPCGGAEDHKAGYVQRVANPALEHGILLNGPALVIHPQWMDNGEIRGRYEDVKIQEGDRFQATIGCLDDAQNCDVTFELRVRVQGESTKTLRTWRQTYDGNLRTIDIDLDSLAGKTVKIFLVVRANGDASDAWAAWVNPRIAR